MAVCGRSRVGDFQVRENIAETSGPSVGNTIDTAGFGEGRVAPHYITSSVTPVRISGPRDAKCS